jgi:aminoglycoside phosphotransferase (APT) family kinase protein
MSEDEVELPKGDVTEGVVRVGNTVRRPHSDVSEGVAAYLAHLESVGFDRAPRYLGRDDKGRDILTFLTGDVPGDDNPPSWAASTTALASVARLTRALHDASAGYRPPQPIQPRDPSRPTPALPDGEPRLISQRDITPGNTVFRNGAAWGLIDFDLSDETTRSIDLANTAMHWVPLRDPVDRRPTDVDVDFGLRLRTMLDAYGRDEVPASLLLEACELRFAGGYAAMKWAAEHLGGGWARMWDAGVGDVSRRRVAWFAAVRDELAVTLGVATTR